MIKVYIEMDEGWRWWPVTEDDPAREYFSKPMTMEVSEELLAEYKTAYDAYRAVQMKLEALFRAQEGYPPHGVFQDLTGADYKLLEK